ncbi:hypothetical protein PMIN04_013128 [Paraphaeosphaeria minitans]
MNLYSRQIAYAERKGYESLWKQDFSLNNSHRDHYHYFEKGANLIPALHNRTDRLALVMNDIVNNQKIVTDPRLKEELSDILDDMGGYKAILDSIVMIEGLTRKLEDAQVALGFNDVAPGRANQEEIKVYLYQNSNYRS